MGILLPWHSSNLLDAIRKINHLEAKKILLFWKIELPKTNTALLYGADSKNSMGILLPWHSCLMRHVYIVYTPIQGVHNTTWHNILSTQFKLNICMYHLSTKKLFILRTFQLDIYLLYLDSMKAWFCNIWNRIVFYHCQKFFII